jgi:hypothetical protein
MSKVEPWRRKELAVLAKALEEMRERLVEFVN